MNKLLLCLSIFLLPLGASSQRVYFVYLQSEQEQPFFVRMEEKTYSSTASGYLILSKLRDSVYQFSVGFPQGKWPEQKFSVTIRSKDHGYLLKNFGEKGWGLFDLQTMSVQMSTNPAREGTMKTEKKEVSAFTDILARAADDSTLRERPVFISRTEEKPPVKEEPKPVPAETVKKETAPPGEPAKVEATKEPPPPVQTETAAVKKEEPALIPAVQPAPAQEEVKEKAGEKPAETKLVETKPTDTILAVVPEQVNKEETKTAESPAYKISVITKTASSTTGEGTGITFIDEQADGTRDTISILVPGEKTVAVLASPPPKEERKFLDLPMDNSVDKKDTVEPAAPAPAVVKPVIKNNCKELATENDFLKLRKKMVGEMDDDDMVDEARKVFKTKCFSTLQIRNLGVLFLDDLGKYKFFDMAYIFVSDIENFASLESELKNEYYVKRFRAMLK